MSASLVGSEMCIRDREVTKPKCAYVDTILHGGRPWGQTVGHPWTVDTCSDQALCAVRPVSLRMISVLPGAKLMTKPCRRKTASTTCRVHLSVLRSTSGEASCSIRALSSM
eukprot:6888008-Alexandrium_andersonii.AAC.1